MLVRIRSKDGNFRFDLQPTDDLSVLVNKILSTSDQIDPDTLTLSNQPRGGENLVSGISGDLQTLGISHGDLLFVAYQPRTAPSALSTHPASGIATPVPPPQATGSTLSGKVVPLDPSSSSSSSSSAPAASTSQSNGSNDKRVQGGPKRPWEDVKEDPVDVFWEGKDGKIPREKGQHGCRCGPKSMCDYCMPLESFDAEYQASNGIKHLSYHAYLKKLHASIPSSAQSSTYIPPLSSESYSVAVPCSSGSHPSWPAGICTKCQPSAVTLSRQTYRMTDHVEFATPGLIDRLLSFWRTTGTQRFGYLLGHYAAYDKVPMGVKAVVEAIHEPPQEPHADGITVGFPWEEEAKVEALAEACGLQVVGVIFTDLTPETDDKGNKTSQVVAKRHANTFFLSSLEVLFAAQLQQKHPTPSRFSTSGKFSSRFVTCVVSGDIEGNIAVEAYQVSDQAMAMVEADMVEASVDPGVVRVKEEGPTRYIPDVFYRYKNKYGIEVKESAKPCFPVEYLLVNVTHGFPVSPSPLFITPSPFPASNRPGFADQTLSSAASSFLVAAKGSSGSPNLELLSGSLGTSEKEVELLVQDEGVKAVAKWASDWNLLRFLAESGMFDETDLLRLCRIAVLSSRFSKSPSVTAERELGKELAKLFGSPGWQTWVAVAQEQAPSPPTRDYPGASSSSQQPTTTADGFEIPPDIDQPPSAFAGGDVDMGGSGGGGGGGGAGDGGVRICPHCTFENAHGGQDCEICGLPLSG
ncbi:hypothetical protein JCM8547_001437 [Rhodosporidiobolus lusitaniae]